VVTCELGKKEHKFIGNTVQPGIYTKGF